jgi:hypothetical protein
LSTKQEIDMTERNNQFSELNVDDLDKVSGGRVTCDNAIAISGVYFLTSHILGLLGDQRGSDTFQGMGMGIQQGSCGPAIKPA